MLFQKIPKNSENLKSNFLLIKYFRQRFFRILCSLIWSSKRGVAYLFTDYICQTSLQIGIVREVLLQECYSIFIIFCIEKLGILIYVRLNLSKGRGLCLFASFFSKQAFFSNKYISGSKKLAKAKKSWYFYWEINKLNHILSTLFHINLLTANFKRIKSDLLKFCIRICIVKNISALKLFYCVRIWNWIMTFLTLRSHMIQF